MRLKVKITTQDRERLAREFELAWRQRAYDAAQRYANSLSPPIQ
jgi:hypothetical protein